MNARDELCKMIQGGLNNGVADYIADALISNGWRKPEQITTVEELDALPGGVVILSAAGVVYVKEFEMFDPGTWWWVTAGAVSEFQSNRISLPATVLHEGAASRDPGR